MNRKHLILLLALVLLTGLAISCSRKGPPTPPQPSKMGSLAI